MLGGNAVFTVNYGASDDVTLTSQPTVVWNGGGGSDTDWSDDANWVNGAGPQAGDSLVFPALSKAQSPTNDLPDASFGAIAVSGSDYTFSGNDLTLTSGVISSGSGNTVNLNIALGADAEIANDSSNTLVIGGTIDLGGNTLTISGVGGETDLNGAISGDGNLSASTNGKVVLSGSNSYGGTTEVVSGTLVLRNALALGAGNDTPATGTTLDNGASLEIDGPFTIANELLTVPGPASTSTTVNIYSYNTSTSGFNVWTGDIYLGTSNSDWVTLNLNSESGSLELDGSIIAR